MQASESEQVLLSSFVPMQPPVAESQASSVQALPSSQPTTCVGVQVPTALHRPNEQASASEQGTLARKLLFWHCVAAVKLQVANLHSC